MDEMMQILNGLKKCYPEVNEIRLSRDRDVLILYNDESMLQIEPEKIPADLLINPNPRNCAHFLEKMNLLQKKGASMAETSSSKERKNHLFMVAHNFSDIGPFDYADEMVGDVGMVLHYQYSLDEGRYYFRPTKRMVEEWGEKESVRMGYRNFREYYPPYLIFYKGFPPSAVKKRLEDTKDILKDEDSAVLTSDQFGASLIFYDYVAGSILNFWRKPFYFYCVSADVVAVVKDSSRAVPQIEHLRKIIQEQLYPNGDYRFLSDFIYRYNGKKYSVV